MKYASFNEFYQYYLSQHQHIMSQRMHFVGCALALLLLIAFVFSFKLSFLFLAIIIGYGFAWAGHYFFEKNHPTSCEHPMYSFMADWMMFKDMITGKIKIW